MPRKDIYKDGVKTQFSSTRRPKNPGRRPNVYAKYIRENRVSLDDQRALFSSMLAYNADEIQKFIEDKKDKPPVGMILLLNAISADLKKKEIANYEKLMDRTFGKPEKTINHSIGQINPETIETLNRFFNEPQKKETSAKKTTAKRKPRTERKE